jgi:uncharacterized protein (DUF3084 family)
MNAFVGSTPKVRAQFGGGVELRTDQTLASFVDRVREETDRLVSLASACDATAHELAEREASVHAREQELADRQRELDTRYGELERRQQQQLKENAAATQQATERIAEAAAREAELRAFARDLLERYSDAPSAMSSSPNRGGTPTPE